MWANLNTNEDPNDSSKRIEARDSDGDLIDRRAHVTASVLADNGAYEEALCNTIRGSGTNVGGALVGSDDKVNVTFEVTAPTFGPGNTNYICMADGEGRTSKTDVEDFNLEPSIKVVPGSVATGDTVNVFAQDYSNTGGGFTLLKIAGTDRTPSGALLFDSENPGDDFVTDRESISATGEGSVTFEVPGGYEGVLRIDAEWCNGSDCISKNSKITIAGAELNSSKTDVRPNETITINGNGFGSQTCIAASDITVDNVPVMIHDDSFGCDPDGITGGEKGVEVSNSGSVRGHRHPVAGR